MGVLGRSLVFEVLSDVRLVVSCQTSALPTDAEWDTWLGAIANLLSKSQDVRLLVASEGGHPTKAQLERLRALNKTNPVTAIVSSSRAYRFMASALTFVNPTIRCFAPADLTKAFEHLKINYADRDRARITMEDLQRRLPKESSANIES